jgi:hypothetical protein
LQAEQEKIRKKYISGLVTLLTTINFADLDVGRRILEVWYRILGTNLIGTGWAQTCSEHGNEGRHGCTI